MLGPLIEWLRVNSTTHVKEAYLDRVIEQQVLFNRALVEEIEQLRSKLARLEEHLVLLGDAQDQTRDHEAPSRPQEPHIEQPG